jgi:uncharacterized Tic20 family protein
MTEPRDPSASGPTGDDPTASGAYGEAAGFPPAPPPPAAEQAGGGYPPPAPGAHPYPQQPYGQQPYGQQPYGQAQWAGGPPPPGGRPVPTGPEDTTWAVLAHVLGIFFSFIAPLVVLLARGKSSAFVRDQAVEALNFQITVLLAYIVSAILIILVIGLFMIFFVGVASIILAIIATIAAGRGEAYRYPVHLRMIH